MKDKDIYVKISQQMGRLPIFLPTNRRKARQDTFICPWGSVKITGVTLTTYDEDVLYTLCRLGKRSYIYLPDGTAQLNTISLKTTYYELLTAMGRAYGTENIKHLKESLESLATTVVTFTTEIYDSTEEKKKDRKKVIKSISPLVYRYISHEDDKDGECGLKLNKGQIYIILSESVSKLLLHSNTYINLTIKKELTPLYQALYRFALSHKGKIVVSIEKLHKAIAPTMDIRQFRMRIKNCDLHADFCRKTGIKVYEDNDMMTICPTKKEEIESQMQIS